jgi:hypothetical protein
MRVEIGFTPKHVKQDVPARSKGNRGARTFDYE